MKDIKDTIINIIIILLMILALFFGVLFLSGVKSGKSDLKECESQGLSLIYPPHSGFQLTAKYYCGNVTELNKTYEMKQALISKWWYYETN